MRVTAEQFIERPPKSLPTLICVHGAEPLGALEAADLVRELARKTGYAEREVFTAEQGFDWSRLTAASSALSLFASQRLLELRIPTGKPGREGAIAIEQYCQRLPDDTITLVLLPEMDWQMKQAKWFAALEAQAYTIESMPVAREHLPRWLAARLARQQQTAGAEALEFLADRVEGNLLAAVQEVRKLALLAPVGEVSLEVVRDSVVDVSRFNPLQLVAAMYETGTAAGAKAARLVRMLDGMKAEGEAPPLILWVLCNELRMLAKLRGVTKGGRAPHPAKARELERISRQHTAGSLSRLNLLAAQADRMIKGLSGDDAWWALAELACGIGGVKLMPGAHAGRK